MFPQTLNLNQKYSTKYTTPSGEQDINGDYCSLSDLNSAKCTYGAYTCGFMSVSRARHLYVWSKVTGASKWSSSYPPRLTSNAAVFSQLVLWQICLATEAVSRYFHMACQFLFLLLPWVITSIDAHSTAEYCTTDKKVSVNTSRTCVQVIYFIGNSWNVQSRLHRGLVWRTLLKSI